MMPCTLDRVISPLGFHEVGCYPGSIARKRKPEKQSTESAKQPVRPGYFRAFTAELRNIAAQAVDWGFDMVTISSDVRLLVAAAAESLGRFQGLTGRIRTGEQDDGGGY